MLLVRSVWNASPHHPKVGCPITAGVFHPLELQQAATAVRERMALGGGSRVISSLLVAAVAAGGGAWGGYTPALVGSGGIMFSRTSGPISTQFCAEFLGGLSTTPDVADSSLAPAAAVLGQRVLALVETVQQQRVLVRLEQLKRRSLKPGRLEPTNNHNSDAARDIRNMRQALRGLFEVGGVEKTRAGTFSWRGGAAMLGARSGAAHDNAASLREQVCDPPLEKGCCRRAEFTPLPTERIEIRSTTDCPSAGYLVRIRCERLRPDASFWA